MNKVHLEKKLIVGLPDALDLTFQMIPEFSEDQELICSWDGDDISYFLTADDQPGGYEHSHYWASIENTLRGSSSDNKVKTMKTGTYNTDDGTEISYRIYKHTQMGEEDIQIYHLINNQNIAYWVITTLLSVGDIFKVNNEIISILKTAELTA